MNHRILDPIRRSPEYAGIQDAIRRGGGEPLSVFGMPEISKIPLVITTYLEQKRPMLLICPNDYMAQRLYAAMSPVLPGETYFLPARAFSFTRAVDSREQRALRIQALTALAGGEPCLVLAGVDGARACLSPRSVFCKSQITVHKGDTLAMDDLIRRLVQGGYHREEAVSVLGEFSLRGGILDVCTPMGAYRLDFFGDEVDSIKTMDPMSQRSLAPQDGVTIAPCVETPMDARMVRDALFIMEREQKHNPSPRLQERMEELRGDNLGYAAEVVPYVSGGTCAVDYLGENGILLLDEPAQMKEAAALSDEDLQDTVTHLGPDAYDALSHQLAAYGELLSAPQVKVQFTTMVQRRARGHVFSLACRSITPFMGRLDLLADELKYRKKGGYTTAIALGNEKRCEALYQTLLDKGVDCACIRDLKPGEVVITPYPIGAGFEYTDGRFILYSEAEIFRQGRAPQRKRKEAAPEAFDLKEGDYAVHDIHGIGIYRGLTSIPVAGVQKDFMLIEYRDGDKLYIPADQLNRVTRYIGSDEAKPKLSRMGGAEWERAKQKVRKGVRELAFDLVAMYAQRQASRGHAFSEDTLWQKEFESAFPFDETEGQQQSIEEIKRDMESPRIMDRLLCGDVGYGKTEVAIRAAFKAVMDAKQVLVLVPTTILAQQHYATFSARCEGYPITVDVLSRFRSKKEQEDVLTRFQSGEVDILIGTHRLLSRDVRPRDLGLLIIDEEHRFGVAHKDTIKNMKKTVDVLTLTATPIPRTLEMSLIGIRDMSVIHTPIGDRSPVTTYVAPYEGELLRQAILREINRNGQTYILYNNVGTMERFVSSVQELVPEARIGMAHGQMGELPLEKAMMAFYNQEVDVLVCSTIIESGLDIPTANTIFIVDADRLGLAQLYQLRGRVGRSSRPGYCYLTYNGQRVMNETAQKRLYAISEFTELGSGYKIAMRDLEIRGAGNLLGPEQHGHMAQVGYDTYCKLLADAIREVKGEPDQPEADASVETSLPAFIPTEYIGNTEQKVAAYKRIAAILDQAGANDVRESLVDRYGALPGPVENLIEVAELKALCIQHGVATAAIRRGECRMKFASTAQVDGAALIQAVEEYGKGATLKNTNPIGLILTEKNATDGKMLKKTMEFLSALPA